jgi:hypothetical protein
VCVCVCVGEEGRRRTRERVDQDGGWWARQTRPIFSIFYPIMLLRETGASSSPCTKPGIGQWNPPSDCKRTRLGESGIAEPEDGIEHAHIHHIC